MKRIKERTVRELNDEEPATIAGGASMVEYQQVLVPVIMTAPEVMARAWVRLSRPGICNRERPRVAAFRLLADCAAVEGERIQRCGAPTVAEAKREIPASSVRSAVPALIAMTNPKNDKTDRSRALKDEELKTATGGVAGLFWAGNVAFVIAADQYSHDVYRVYVK